MPRRRLSIHYVQKEIVMSRLTSICFAMVSSAVLAGAGCAVQPPGAPEDIDPADQATASAVGGARPVESDALGCQRRGMTWRWGGRTVDVDSVGSDSITNVYSGDTQCNNSLPLLCIRRVGAPQPAYITSSFYNGWTGGYVALTRAHLGTDMTSAAVADSICAAELGAGWEMGEFHDGGGGWNFQAYGAVTHPERFWAMINDQPANCWNSAPL